jgi:hypothetical protein
MEKEKLNVENAYANMPGCIACLICFIQPETGVELVGLFSIGDE